jgi:hypothetical protein
MSAMRITQEHKVVKHSKQPVQKVEDGTTGLFCSVRNIDPLFICLLCRFAQDDGPRKNTCNS